MYIKISRTHSQVRSPGVFGNKSISSWSARPIGECLPFCNPPMWRSATRFAALSFASSGENRTCPLVRSRHVGTKGTLRASRRPEASRRAHQRARLAAPRYRGRTRRSTAPLCSIVPAVAASAGVWTACWPIANCLSKRDLPHNG